MSEQAHTPLPWTFWSNATGAWMIESGPAVICQRSDWNSRATESVANGRLFFAAPDLLAVAKEAFGHIPFHTSDCEGVTEYEEGAIFDATKGCTCFLSRLRAAIAKAQP